MPIPLLPPDGLHHPIFTSSGLQFRAQAHLLARQYLQFTDSRFLEWEEKSIASPRHQQRLSREATQIQVQLTAVQPHLLPLTTFRSARRPHHVRINHLHGKQLLVQNIQSRYGYPQSFLHSLIPVTRHVKNLAPTLHPLGQTIFILREQATK